MAIDLLSTASSLALLAGLFINFCLPDAAFCVGAAASDEPKDSSMPPRKIPNENPSENPPLCPSAPSLLLLQRCGNLLITFLVLSNYALLMHSNLYLPCFFELLLLLLQRAAWRLLSPEFIGGHFVLCFFSSTWE